MSCKQIFNAKIESKKLVLFSPPKSNQVSCAGDLGEELPPIESSMLRKQSIFNLPIIVEKYPYPSKCRRVFNGTLHVIGRKTIQNLFHAREYLESVGLLVLTFDVSCNSQR